jgi:hypothetical protein
MAIRIGLPQIGNHLVCPFDGDCRVGRCQAVELIDKFPCEQARAVAPARDEITQPIAKDAPSFLSGEEGSGSGKRAAAPHIVRIERPIGADIRARRRGRHQAYRYRRPRGGARYQLLFPLVRVNFELGVIMVIAVSCVKLLSAHNSTQHTSRKHKV